VMHACMHGFNWQLQWRGVVQRCNVCVFKTCWLLALPASACKNVQCRC
jgi:hypothetical protein